MKVIQSFWSKPFVHPASNTLEARYQGGFINESQFIYTWALSLLSLKEVFSSIHLNTDEKGKKAWIDFFELPYDTYSTELNEIDFFPSDLWASGKLYTYANVKEPFVHFDIDVVVGKKFDRNKLENDLFVEFQYDDSLLKRYNIIIKKLLSYGIKMSPEFLEILSDNNFVYKDYNMGITGGYDYSFFNKYAQQSLSYLNENLPFCQTIDNVTKSFLNCFFEQYNFYAATLSDSKIVNKLVENNIIIDCDYQKQKIDAGFGNFDFVHFHGGYKRLYPEISEKWLKEYFPEFYNNINEKLKFIYSNK